MIKPGGIGFCGAHRVGKTTLARAVSKQTGLKLIETDSTSVVNATGVDMKKVLDFLELITVQMAILKSLTDQYESSSGSMFITDRTPVDALAYTTAEYSRISMNVMRRVYDQSFNVYIDKMDTLYHLYRDQCFNVLNAYFGVVILVPPGIPVIHEEGKAPPHLGYIEHISDLCGGVVLTINDRCPHISTFRIKREMLDLQERVNAVNLCLNHEIGEYFTNTENFILQ